MVTLASIQTGIQLADNFTAPLMHIISSVNMAVSHMEELNNTMNTNVDTASYEGIRSELSQASVAATNLSQELSNINTPAATAARSVSQIGNEIQENTQNQQRFNQGLQSGVTSAKTFVSAIAGLSVVRSVISTITGQLDAAMNRMDTMTNYSRAMTAISGDADVAGASLERLKEITKGTAYGLDTAASSVQNFVTRGLGVASSVNQMKKWADAVAFYGDGTNEQLTNVTDALGKMLSKGKVEMDQLDRLTDAGINAVGIYAQATNQGTASVQNDLSKGKISAQDFITTVSTAFSEGTNGVLNISGAAKEAGGTWATSIANAKAAVTRGLISLIDGINGGLTNAGFGTILDNVTNFGTAAENTLNKLGNSAGTIIGLLGPPLNMLRSAGTFIAENWDDLIPIIGGVAAAVIAYNGVLTIYNATQTVSNTLKAISIAYSAINTGKTLAEAAAIKTATGAQVGLNTALLACPWTWLIIALAAVVAGLIYVYKEFGSLKIMLMVFQQIFMTMWENFLYCLTLVEVNVAKFVAGFKTGFYTMGQGIVSVLTWMGADALSIIQDMVNGAIDLVNMLINTVNKIPGVSLEGVQRVTFGTDAQIQAQAADAAAKANIEKYAQQQQENVDIVKQWSDDYYAKIGAKQQKREAAIDKAMTEQAKLEQKSKNPSVDKYKNYKLPDNSLNPAIAKNTSDTAKNTAKTANAVAVTAEDLKYLRELAEVETVNRFTTAKITVNQTNHNTINKDMDLDGVTEHLRSTMEEQMLASAQGVY